MTTAKNNTRNANRTTIIKGFVFNPETQANEAFEIETEYVRATDKARKFAAKSLDVDANFIIVTDVHNEPLKKVEYNNGKIIEFSLGSYDSFEYAVSVLAEMEEADCKIVEYVRYVYSAQAWLFDPEEKTYSTQYVYAYSPLKMTRLNARSFLKMETELLEDCKVLGLHDDGREEQKRFAIVREEDLEKCLK